MRRLASILNWFALISAVAFLVIGIGRNLHAELLAIPIIALALAQVIGRNSLR